MHMHVIITKPYLPHVHAEGVKQLVLSVVICHRHENCQISSSVHAVISYHELVDISEKLVSAHFELLNMAH